MGIVPAPKKHLLPTAAFIEDPGENFSSVFRARSCRAGFRHGGAFELIEEVFSDPGRGNCASLLNKSCARESAAPDDPSESVVPRSTH